MAKRKFKKFKHFADHLENHDDLSGAGEAASRAKWTGYATALGAVDSIASEAKSSKKLKKKHRKAVRALHDLANHAGGKKAVRPPKKKTIKTVAVSVEVAGPRADNVVALRRVAPPKAASASPETLDAPRNGVADDLKMIAGVGPKLEKVLNSLGVFHFDQIAAWTPKDVIWVDDHLRFSGRITRENWIAQAAALAKGGREQYDKIFGKEPR